MSSLFGEALDVTRPGVDFVTASANKCLQGVPGVSFVLARRAALDALAGQPPRSVYLDLHGHYRSQESDNTPFTPAVQVLHAMEQALVELEKEGAGGPRGPVRRERPGAAGRDDSPRPRDPDTGERPRQRADDVPPAGRRHLRRAPRRDEAARLRHLRRPGPDRDRTRSGWPTWGRSRRPTWRRSWRPSRRAWRSWAPPEGPPGVSCEGTTRLRQLVTRPEIAFLMEAHDGLSARIAAGGRLRGGLGERPDRLGVLRRPGQ